MTPCPRCSRQMAPSYFVCGVCAGQAKADLDRIADWIDLADEKRARRGSKMWVGGGIVSAVIPMPGDPRVTTTIRPIAADLADWARTVITHHHCRDFPDPAATARVAELEGRIIRAARIPAAAAARLEQARGTGASAELIDELGERLDDLTARAGALRRQLGGAIVRARADVDLATNPAAVARWIGDHAERVATRSWAEGLLDFTGDARETLDQLFDNPPEQIPLGRCGHTPDPDTHAPCTAVLTTARGDAYVQCPRCGQIVDARERRAAAIHEAQDLLVTVREALHLLKMEGHNIDKRTLYAVIRVAGITSETTTPEPGSDRPVSMYRLGALDDAVTLLASDPDTQRAVARVKRGNAVPALRGAR